MISLILGHQFEEIKELFVIVVVFYFYVFCVVQMFYGVFEHLFGLGEGDCVEGVGLGDFVGELGSYGAVD